MRVINQNQYNLKGKKVLVTGAGGFIGSHLAERLVELGAEVRAFVHYNSRNNWGWLETLPKKTMANVEVVAGDIRDHDSVFAGVKGVDIVFHLAALISIPYSYISPFAFFETNVKGTLNILEASHKTAVDRVLVTSTSEVYGTAKYVPIDEKHPLKAQSPYSATKIGADRLAESFYCSFDLPVTIVRPFNTYGPRQSARAVIPTIIIQLLTGWDAIELGKLSTSRDFVYVSDTVDGFLEIAKSEKTIGQEINICTEREISIGQLVNQIASQINPEVAIRTNSERLRPAKSEVERLLGSNEKISLLTKWKPQWSVEKGILQTIDWFSNPENTTWYKPYLYSI
jgi:dTDP-glucose 4,6-dehydratase